MTPGEIRAKANDAAAELPHFTQCYAITEPNAACRCNEEAEKVIAPALSQAYRQGREDGLREAKKAASEWQSDEETTDSIIDRLDSLIEGEGKGG